MLSSFPFFRPGSLAMREGIVMGLIYPFHRQYASDESDK
jgi:hypothetical protein